MCAGSAWRRRRAHMRASLSKRLAIAPFARQMRASLAKCLPRSASVCIPREPFASLGKWWHRSGNVSNARQTLPSLGKRLRRSASVCDAMKVLQSTYAWAIVLQKAVGRRAHRFVCARQTWASLSEALGGPGASWLPFSGPGARGGSRATTQGRAIVTLQTFQRYDSLFAVFPRGNSTLRFTFCCFP